MTELNLLLTAMNSLNNTNDRCTCRHLLPSFIVAGHQSRQRNILCKLIASHSLRTTTKLTKIFHIVIVDYVVWQSCSISKFFSLRSSLTSDYTLNWLQLQRDITECFTVCTEVSAYKFFWEISL